jgi:hypothetical protein
MAVSAPPPLLDFRGDHPLLKRWVVSLVLLFSLLIGFAGLGGLVILLLGGAISVFLLLRWPLVGIVLLIPTSLLVPFGIGTGTATSINATVILLVLLLGIWALRMVGGRSVRLIASPAIPPLLALVGIAILASLAGLQPWILFAQTAGWRSSYSPPGPFCWRRT